MKIYIGADHRGFTLKEQMKKQLEAYGVEDMSPDYNEDDDYPKVAKKVATKVVGDKDAVGIVLCGSGIGVDMAANKVKGARAGLALNPHQVKEARKADNINILALAADYTTPQDAKELVDAFLNTQYAPKPRRERRLNEINQIEK